MEQREIIRPSSLSPQSTIVWIYLLANEYSNIGINNVGSVLPSPNCLFFLYDGTKKPAKQKEFGQCIRDKFEI